jgi:hypothetical protein
VLHVTPDEHVGLAWGARGGTSALGIVTEVETVDTSLAV